MPGNKPEKNEPDPNWRHYELWNNVKDVLLTLPTYYESETYIAGLEATDNHTLSEAFGTTIEKEVVNTLNRVRSVWDPEDKYEAYSFKRQPQTFPDVIFSKSAEEIIMGIEMKSWYLLAKEKEPNFRFKATKKACTEQDLIVVVPWALEDVISGNPLIYEPYIELSRYVCDWRNYYWQELRDTDLDTTIDSPDDVQPYPDKSEEIIDRPKKDSGGNYGRIARTGIMDNYVERIQSEPISGIEVKYWQRFIKMFTENKSNEAIEEEFEHFN